MIHCNLHIKFHLSIIVIPNNTQLPFHSFNILHEIALKIHSHHCLVHLWLHEWPQGRWRDELRFVVQIQIERSIIQSFLEFVLQHKIHVPCGCHVTSRRRDVEGCSDGGSANLKIELRFWIWMSTIINNDQYNDCDDDTNQQ